MPDRDRSVADRLRRLRGQSGLSEPAASDPGSADGAPSFTERVHRLMVGRGRSASRTPDESVLIGAIGAERIAPGVLLIERTLGREVRHGRVRLDPPWQAAERPSCLLALTGSAGACEGGARLCCFDTETSGLAGGTGTWAFLSGFLRHGPQGWRLTQLLLTSLESEAVYLDAVVAQLAGASPLVSYNGRSFDAPLLATRFRLAGQHDPFGDLPHLDLLAPMRRAYGSLWPDCRLASAELRLLGVAREGDLPGSAAPAAWLGWLRRGEIQPLAAVLRHNRWDLLSLAGLLPVIDACFADPAAHDADCHAIASHYVARGQGDDAVRILESDRRRLGPAGLLELARLYRQRRDWDAAVPIWERLAAAEVAQARLALAKYHEHHSGNLARALEYALALPVGPERQRRCERLSLKIALRPCAS